MKWHLACFRGLSPSRSRKVKEPGIEEYIIVGLTGGTLITLNTILNFLSLQHETVKQ